MSALEHMIQYFCHFSLPELAALLRSADSSKMCFLILALCLAASIAVQNLAALLMPTSEGIRLILLNYCAQWIVDIRILVQRKPKLIFLAATFLSEKSLDRLNISESPSVRILS